MARLEPLLETLLVGDPRQKEELLSDLAELLNRSAYAGKGGDFSFRDPRLVAQPEKLPPDIVRLIAARVAPVLLDLNEAEQVRAASAFVLGKTCLGEALAAIVEAVSSPARLESNVSRQCAIAFDTLVAACPDEMKGPDLDVVGRHLERQGG